MHIINGELIRSDTTSKAMGGTELLSHRLVEALPKELLDEVQIVVSRLKFPLDETKIRIYYCHDLPNDPESAHLANGGWAKFHRLVFVSNWQMQQYVSHYNIPWAKCVVIQNSVVPIEAHEKPKDKIRLAYWSTPHRGLSILYPVFAKLCEVHPDIELNVYSSFKLYGWEESDAPFKPIFDALETHPQVNYHGTVSNEVLREELKKQHILAYPNTWVETSCLVLMEAMTAGMLAVHPNLGALYETAAGWTSMYQYQETDQQHANHFYQHLNRAIEIVKEGKLQEHLATQKTYADVFYNPIGKHAQWESLLVSLLNEPRALQAEEYFTFRT